jgi:hypothetical protein
MPTLSHYAARVRYRLPEEQNVIGGGRERRREQERTLKAAGWDGCKVFQYTDGNEEQKVKAKAAAEAYAAEWTEKTGVPLQVIEGFFL